MNKKSLVLETATRLFAESGFENTSVAQICAEAEVSKGLVYHHFSSKEAILKAIFSETTDRMIDMSGQESTDSAQVQLEQLINTVLDQVQEDKLFFQLNLNIMFQPKTRALLRELISIRAAHLLASVKKIFDAISPSKSEVLSYMLIAELDGIALNYLSVFESYPIESLKAHMLDKYRNIGEQLN